MPMYERRRKVASSTMRNGLSLLLTRSDSTALSIMELVLRMILRSVVSAGFCATAAGIWRSRALPTMVINLVWNMNNDCIGFIYGCFFERLQKFCIKYRAM